MNFSRQQISNGVIMMLNVGGGAEGSLSHLISSFVIEAIDWRITLYNPNRKVAVISR